MIEITSAVLLALVKFGYDAIKDIRQSSKERREAGYKALQSLATAARKTEDYLKERRSGSPENRDTEGELASRWRAVAADFGRFNDDIAERFFIKAGYWDDPQQWTNEDVKKARIGLSQIRAEAEQLLRDNRGQ